MVANDLENKNENINAVEKHWFFVLWIWQHCKLHKVLGQTFQMAQNHFCAFSTTMTIYQEILVNVF